MPNRTSLLAALLVSLIASSAAAEENGATLNRSAYPPAPMLSRQHGRRLRSAGVALTVIGIAASALGPIVGPLGDFSSTHVSYDTSFPVALAGVFVGGALIGTGAGLWNSGDSELRRVDGIALGARTLPSRETRAAHARKLTVNGAVVTAIGAALALTSFIPLVVEQNTGPGCYNERCLGGFFGGLGMGVGSAVHLAVGIPLLVAGYKKKADLGPTSFRIDGLAPQVMNGGGGVGMSGRF